VRRAAIVTGLAAALAVARPARADAPARLLYSAPVGCPDAGSFASAVRERAPRAQLSVDAPRTFTVTITAADDGFAGTLATPDAGAPRALAASRCDDLAAALALVTALAIDPSSADAPIAPLAAVSAPPAPPPPPPRGVALPRYGLAAFVAPEIDGGIAPDALPAASVEARLLRRGLGHLDLGGALGRDTGETAAGAARFTWMVARISACWTAIEARVAVDACGDAEGGALEAEGVNVVRAQDLRRLWVSAGVHAAARVDVTASIFAELRVGASAPLTRDRFYFTPDVFVHEATALTPWIGVGVGARFW
jgi:hypothetical protein